MTEPSPEKKGNNPRIAPATSIMDEYPHKVFVGNLSFDTTDDSLTEFFQTVANVYAPL